MWIWDGSSGTYFNLLQSHEKPVTCGRFTLDGKQVISGSKDATVKVWNIKTAQVEHTIKGYGFHEGEVICMDLHSKSSIFATGSSDNTVCIGNYANGKVFTLDLRS